MPIDETLLLSVMAILGAAALLCLYRVAAGPGAADRAAALSAMGALAIGVCALLALRPGSGFLMNVAICAALVSFLGSVAMAKYLEGKHFDE